MGVGGVVVAQVVLVRLVRGHQRFLVNVVFSVSMTRGLGEDESISDHLHTEARQGIPGNNSAI